MKYYYDPEYDRIVDESVPVKQYANLRASGWLAKSLKDFVADNFIPLRTVADAEFLDCVTHVVGRDGLELAMNDKIRSERIIWIMQDEDCFDGYYELVAACDSPRCCDNCRRRISGDGLPCSGYELEEEYPDIAMTCADFLPRDRKEERAVAEYTPCATYGDYSPSSPWNAPGMSIHDFI